MEIRIINGADIMGCTASIAMPRTVWGAVERTVCLTIIYNIGAE